MKHLLEYGLLRWLVFVLALWPFRLMPLLSRPLYFLLYRLIGYRKKVVLDNLRQAFPQKTKTEIQSIARAFYLQLAEVLLETLKGLSMSEATFRSRYRFRNAAIFQELFEQGRSAIIAGGHFGNWEWGSFSFPLWVSATVVGIYKPVKNPYVEAFLRQRRCRWDLRLAAMSQTGRALVQYRKQASLFVLIADQSPSNLEAAHWLPFMGRTTPFLNGLGKIAKRSAYPVYYFDIQRVRSHEYVIDFRLLCKNPHELEEEEITRRFKEELEYCIHRNPESWLWSHRRWKHAK